MRYQVKALRPDGGIVSLSLEAGGETHAQSLAESQGLSVLDIRRQGGRAWPSLAGSSFPLPMFSQELRVLLSAGITLSESLEALSEREHKPHIRAIITNLLESLREGRTLSDAMARQPEAFPPLYVAAIRASETSGELEDALDRYLAYHGQIDTVRKKIVSASVYPVLLIGLGSLVMLFLLVYVVPRFSQIYADHANNLSFASRMLLGWGRFVSAHGWQLAGTAGAVLALFALWIRQPASRAWLSLQWRRMPGIGDKLLTFHLARLYRTLAMLLRGGIPATQALDMASGVVEAGMRRQLSLARAAVSEGMSLSESFSRHGLATPVALRLLRVAERTGRMGEMLESAATFHEDELARDIDMFTRLFEPLLMTVIGVVIGTVVLLMYIPIFELASAIQ